MKVVVDNSGLIPLFFEKEKTKFSQKLFSSSETIFLAPNFLAIEFANVLSTGIKRGRLNSSEAESHLQNFLSMGIQLVDFPNQANFQKALDLSVRRNLSFYDAIYLLLAHQESCQLVTLDRKLREASKAEGVSCYPLR